MKIILKSVFTGVSGAFGVLAMISFNYCNGDLMAPIFLLLCLIAVVQWGKFLLEE